MGLVIGITQTLLRDVGVDLGGREGGMPKESLDRSQVGTVIEEVSGKGVTKFMRGDIERNGRLGEVFLKNGV